MLINLIVLLLIPTTPIHLIPTLKPAIPTLEQYNHPITIVIKVLVILVVLIILD